MPTVTESDGVAPNEVRGDLSIETIAHSGALRISVMRGGHRGSKLYFGYEPEEAIERFNAEFPPDDQRAFNCLTGGIDMSELNTRRTLQQEQADVSLVDQLRDGLRSQCTPSGLMGIHPEYMYVESDLIEGCFKDLDRMAMKQMLGEGPSNLEKLACMLLLNCARITKKTPHRDMPKEAKEKLC